MKTCNFFYFLLPPLGSLLQLLEHRADFSVFWLFTDGRTPWTGDQLVARSVPKHRTTQTKKNAHTLQTSMPWVGFETTIPASERAKTVHRPLGYRDRHLDRNYFRIQQRIRLCTNYKQTVANSGTPICNAEFRSQLCYSLLLLSALN
jgi:hypothetical protein